MLDAITSTQIAMLQDQLQLQSISQNITNMTTPGYKRQLLENTSFDGQLQATMSTVSQHMQASWQASQGVAVESKNPDHLALSAEGFFEVQNEKNVFYTRRGDFHVNEQGELALATGEILLGKGGPVHVDDSQFSIDAQGNLSIDQQQLDQISTVRFAHPENLSYLGQGLYTSTEPPLPSHPTTHLLQGFIEQSNVKSIDEMIAMLRTSRHFESMQRIMRTADALLSKAINQLGETNV